MEDQRLILPVLARLSYRQPRTKLGIGECLAGIPPTIFHSPFGPCAGVFIYGPAQKKGGALHSLLPYAPKNTPMEDRGKYADLGAHDLAELLTSKDKGHNCLRSNLRAAIVGGAFMPIGYVQQESPPKVSIVLGKDMANFPNEILSGSIHPNIESAYAALCNEGIPVHAIMCGGNTGFSAEFDLSSGKVLVHASGEREYRLLANLSSPSGVPNFKNRFLE